MLKTIDSKLGLFASELDSNEDARGEGLTIFVVGASGDLAKKKTYPSLFELFRNNFHQCTRSSFHQKLSTRNCNTFH